MPTLRPIRKNIIFKFIDDVVVRNGNTQFKEATSWGFEISSYDESSKKPRWATVESVGPEVGSDIQAGTIILIEPLKWTKSVVFEDDMVWQTNEDCVLAVLD